MLRLFLFLAIALMTACSANLEHHKLKTPELNLFEYFTGNTKAWGMVKDLRGNQVNRFEVDIKGTRVDENTLKLVEDFVYENGDTQQRIWYISRLPDKSFIGTANDIIGEAKGVVQGNTLQWQYKFRLKTEQGEIDLSVDDWMFLQDEQHLFNLTEMKKFGITVATVHLFFKRDTL